MADIKKYRLATISPIPIQKEAKLTADSPSVRLTNIVPIPIEIKVNKPMMIIIWLSNPL